MGIGSQGLGMLPDGIEKVLIDADAIQSRVTELARTISSDYAGVEQVLLVGVLKGAFIFLADLTRQFAIPPAVDFVALSSYGRSSSTTGVVRTIMDVRINIANRHVLIVEDIVDSGHTLDYLVRNFRTRQPASLATCVLLSKRGSRRIDVAIDYLGFEIPNSWVVGYGLDYADKYRTLPYIAVLDVKHSASRSIGEEKEK